MELKQDLIFFFFSFLTRSEFCEIGSNIGCQNGGICSNQTVPGLRTVPFCGCPFGFSPPQCAGSFSPPPICNSRNASDVPPGCAFCDPRTNNGCANSGTCYYETRLPGVPLPGLPICGCGIKFSPPSCTFASPVLPICDPNNATHAPPSCNFCDPTTNEVFLVC